MFALLFRYRDQLKGIRGGYALMASGILFLTLSGTIGNSSSFLFLFVGIQLGYISHYKQVALENNIQISDAEANENSVNNEDVCNAEAIDVES